MIRCHSSRPAWRVLALALVTAVPLGVAAQQKSPMTPEALFQRIDADGDGKLSQQETAVAPNLAARFDEVDKNKDGMLSREEFMAVVKPSQN